MGSGDTRQSAWSGQRGCTHHSTRKALNERSAAQKDALEGKVNALGKVLLLRDLGNTGAIPRSVLGGTSDRGSVNPCLHVSDPTCKTDTTACPSFVRTPQGKYSREITSGTGFL